MLGVQKKRTAPLKRGTLSYPQAVQVTFADTHSLTSSFRSVKLQRSIQLHSEMAHSPDMFLHNNEDASSQPLHCQAWTGVMSLSDMLQSRHRHAPEPSALTVRTQMHCTRPALQRRPPYKKKLHRATVIVHESHRSYQHFHLILLPS